MLISQFCQDRKLTYIHVVVPVTKEYLGFKYLTINLQNNMFRIEYLNCKKVNGLFQNHLTKIKPTTACMCNKNQPGFVQLV